MNKKVEKPASLVDGDGKVREGTRSRIDQINQENGLTDVFVEGKIQLSSSNLEAAADVEKTVADLMQETSNEDESHPDGTNITEFKSLKEGGRAKEDFLFGVQAAIRKYLKRSGISYTDFRIESLTLPIVGGVLDLENSNIKLRIELPQP
ncbi:MAG: hypothetical protein ABIE14_05295 [Patescibacteria group bacterium]